MLIKVLQNFERELLTRYCPTRAAAPPAGGTAARRYAFPVRRQHLTQVTASSARNRYAAWVSAQPPQAAGMFAPGCVPNRSATRASQASPTRPRPPVPPPSSSSYPLPSSPAHQLLVRLPHQMGSADCSIKMCVMDRSRVCSRRSLS